MAVRARHHLCLILLTGMLKKDCFFVCRCKDGRHSAIQISLSLLRHASESGQGEVWSLMPTLYPRIFLRR